MDRRSVGELSDTIGSIYDCAFDPALWPSTLAMLRRHMNFANASLDVLALPAGTILLNVVSGVDEAWVRRTPEYGSDAIEQWGGAEKMRGFPLDEPIVMSVVSPQGLTRANRYYAEWAEPQESSTSWRSGSRATRRPSGRSASAATGTPARSASPS